MSITIVASVTTAPAQTGKIVGLGAARCDIFTGDAQRNPAIQRDYFAWAQGFMSGVLLSRPPGFDEDLDLVPQSVPLVRQVEWLRQYCSDNPGEDFTDAVLSLYRRLQKEKDTVR